MENKTSIRYRIYRYKFYLDANHFIYSEGKKGHVHPHTWEFAIELKNKNGDFVLFRDIERIINEVFAPYQGTCLNDMKPFDNIEPTMENVGEYFEDVVSERMLKMNWELLKVEISETPSRAYVIKNS